MQGEANKERGAGNGRLGGFFLHRAITNFVERKSWVARKRERGKERGGEIYRTKEGREGVGGSRREGGREGGTER